MIVCGGSHNIILTKNNELYVCGRNIEHQLSFDMEIIPKPDFTIDVRHRTNKILYTKLECNLRIIKNIYCRNNYSIIG